MVGLDVVVAVPGLACAVPNLNEAYPTLQQPPGDHHLARLHSLAVHLPDAFWFLGEVEGIVGFHLHAICQLKRLHSRLEKTIVLAALLIALVQFAEQVKLPALFGSGGVLVADVLDQLVDLRLARVDVGRLVGSGQERGPPVLISLRRQAIGAQDDEAGKILILRAQPVRDPGTEAGADLPNVAAIHHHQRRLVIRDVGMHGADDAQIVDALSDIRKDFADFDTVLAVFLELKRRGERGSGAALGFQSDGNGLARELCERRLGIEGIDVGAAAVHEQVENSLRLRRLRRSLGSHRICRSRRGRLQMAGLPQQRGQGDGAHAHAAALQQFAPRQE